MIQYLRMHLLPTVFTGVKTYLAASAISIFVTVSPAHAAQLVGLTTGDSITQGLFRTFAGVQSGITSPQFGSQIGGYQPFAISSFNNDSTDSLVLFNWGFAGRNSAQGISQVRDALGSRSADYNFINFGANDLYQGIGPSSNAFHIATMIDDTTEAGVVPIVGTITPNTNAPGLNNFIIGSYNPGIRNVVAGRKVPLADLHAGMNPAFIALHSGDGLHLNSTGNNFMGSIFADALVAYIESLVEPEPEPEPEPDTINMDGPYLLLLDTP